MWTQKSIHFPLVFLFIFLNLNICTVKCLDLTTEETTTPSPCKIDCSSEIPNSHCNPMSEKCECFEGYIRYDPDSEECSKDFDSFSCLRRWADYTESCVADIQCTSSLGDLSFCDMYGYCNCFSNASMTMYYDDDEDSDFYICVLNNQPTKLGNFCEYRSEECEPIPGAVCINDVCACAWGWVQNSDRTACLKEAARVGEICEVENQCDFMYHTECKEVDGKKSCQCMHGYVINSRGNGCIAGKKLGSYCFDSNECFDNHTECLPFGDWDRKCQCAAGYTDCYGGCCLIQNRVGGQCEYNLQCQAGLLGFNSRCNFTTGQCECTKNTILGSDGVCHYTAMELGDYCTVDEECFNLTNDSDSSGAVGCLFNYTTGETHCQCASGFTASENGLCVEMRHHGDPCASDDDCIAGIGKNALCLIFEDSGEEPWQEEGSGDGDEDGWGFCDCAPGFVISTDGTKCIVGELKEDDICSESRQCGAFPRNLGSTDGIMICDSITKLCKLV